MKTKLAISFSVTALLLAFACSDTWQALWSAPATRTPARETMSSASPRFVPTSPMIRESVSYYPQLDVQVQIEGYRDYVDYIYRRHNGKNDTADPVATPATVIYSDPEQYVMEQLYTEPFPEIIQTANPNSRDAHRYYRYGSGWWHSRVRAVPEPPTWLLIAIGLLGCLILRHRRHK